MKVMKNPEYDYEGKGVSEKNGYIKWYNWDVVKKHVTVMGIAIQAAITVAAILMKPMLAEYGKKNVVIAALVALAILLVAVVPLHEILHLVTPSRGRLDDRCIITFAMFRASALFNDFQTRRGYILGLIFPVLVLGAVFLLAMLLSEGMLKLIFGFLLVMSIYSGYTDIYMFFYSLRHIGKNDIVFGLYKKSADK